MKWNRSRIDAGSRSESRQVDEKLPFFRRAARDRRMARRAKSAVLGAGPSRLDRQMFWGQVRREVERCRRYGRSFVVVRFELRDGSGAATVAPDLLTTELRRTLRDSDDFLLEGADLFLLLTESRAASVTGLLCRLVESTNGAIGEEPRAVVAFPDDALTPVALVDRLFASYRGDLSVEAAIRVRLGVDVPEDVASKVMSDQSSS